jgi:hypothetical protein
MNHGEENGISNRQEYPTFISLLTRKGRKAKAEIEKAEIPSFHAGVD